MYKINKKQCRKLSEAPFYNQFLKSKLIRINSNKYESNLFFIIRFDYLP
jgi:hypothetical protein